MLSCVFVNNASLLAVIVVHFYGWCNSNMREVIDVFASKVSSDLDRFFMNFQVCFSCRLFSAGGSRRDGGLYMYS